MLAHVHSSGTSLDVWCFPHPAKRVAIQDPDGMRRGTCLDRRLVDWGMPLHISSLSQAVASGFRLEPRRRGVGKSKGDPSRDACEGMHLNGLHGL